jgi:hypothetical protein
MSDKVKVAVLVLEMFTGLGEMEYADYLQRLSQDHPELAREIGSLHSMEGVLKWMDRRGLSVAAIDLIQQDEYNHDVLIPLEIPGRHLVFGIT